MNLEEISEVIQCLVEYKQIPNYILQLGNNSSGKIESYFRKVTPNVTGEWRGNVDRGRWENISLHVVPQMWGNTSGGRQNIGGAAMTEAYTTIIENKYNLAFIFYYGKISYICVMDETYKELKDNGFRLPGNKDCVHKLEVLYVNPN